MKSRLIFQGERKPPAPPLFPGYATGVGGSTIFDSELTETNNELTSRVFKFVTPRFSLFQGERMLLLAATPLTVSPQIPCHYSFTCFYSNTLNKKTIPCPHPKIENNQINRKYNNFVRPTSPFFHVSRRRVRTPIFPSNNITKKAKLLLIC